MGIRVQGQEHGYAVHTGIIWGVVGLRVELLDYDILYTESPWSASISIAPMSYDMDIRVYVCLSRCRQHCIPSLPSHLNPMMVETSSSSSGSTRMRSLVKSMPTMQVRLSLYTGTREQPYRSKVKLKAATRHLQDGLPFHFSVHMSLYMYTIYLHYAHVDGLPQHYYPDTTCIMFGFNRVYNRDWVMEGLQF